MLFGSVLLLFLVFFLASTLRSSLGIIICIFLPVVLMLPKVLDFPHGFGITFLKKITVLIDVLKEIFLLWNFLPESTQGDDRKLLPLSVAPVCFKDKLECDYH